MLLGVSNLIGEILLANIGKYFLTQVATRYKNKKEINLVHAHVCVI
jgi:hypothetical protein